MSAVEKVGTPKPQKPWAATPLDRSKGVGVLAVAALVALGVLASTPLKGKLAYVLVFFVAYLIVDSIVSFRRAGRAAAADTLFRGLVTSAIVLAVTPIVSILASVWTRGHKGLHWTLFTKDMHSNAYTDPVIQGGLLHAIITCNRGNGHQCPDWNLDRSLSYRSSRPLNPPNRIFGSGDVGSPINCCWPLYLCLNFGSTHKGSKWI
jgi:hypothetical protein